MALHYSRVVAVLLACFFFSTPVFAQNATKVVVAPVEQSDFSDPVDSLGTLRANESVMITANVSDVITAIHFTDNQNVEKGDVLVEMANLEEAALLEEARSNLEEAAQQLERVRPLVERGISSQSVLDERRRDYRSAQARLRAVESRLADRLITAPFSGATGLRNISVGALVTPGTPITTLDDLSHMKMDFDVPERFLDSLVPGLAVRAVAAAYPEQVFEGEIASIDSRVDPVTRAVRVRALLNNDDHLLRPGMLMRVSVARNPRETLVIPEIAVTMEGEDHFVFVVSQDEAGDNIVQRRQIEVGSRRQGDIEVLAGLSAGDLVITHGTMKVRHGSQVVIGDAENGSKD